MPLPEAKLVGKNALAQFSGAVAGVIGEPPMLDDRGLDSTLLATARQAIAKLIDRKNGVVLLDRTPELTATDIRTAMENLQGEAGEAIKGRIMDLFARCVEISLKTPPRGSVRDLF